MVVKTRKQGNSLMITIPSNLGVSENEEFTLSVEKDGTIVFKPAHVNIFANLDSKLMAKDREDLGITDNLNAVGKENVWD